MERGEAALMTMRIITQAVLRTEKTSQNPIRMRSTPKSRRKACPGHTDLWTPSVTQESPKLKSSTKKAHLKANLGRTEQLTHDACEQSPLVRAQSHLRVQLHRIWARGRRLHPTEIHRNWQKFLSPQKFAEIQVRAGCGRSAGDADEPRFMLGRRRGNLLQFPSCCFKKKQMITGTFTWVLLRN